MWGHHEADLGSWRAPRYRMGRPFIEEYQRRLGMDFPAEDWDDRNLLYAIAKESMRYFVEKYPGGFDAWREPTATT
ncbi:hypothetical protein Z517_01028 [Fonsecaea pedrosoi CBS 271.37]|uniref:Unplaced genomic scaffold supercont1.1, whole genome shotgun sequence n=1 Tax=Fonsecaea pedrosoi CBS 271.37 TaxID=1442368 RepID=A0A0D2E6D3_9EURO|nr:uncharacterized protein Z517_01028 [Fonsecaea pedrosoi CBS 271.37]KIW85636.1 hypothetical protein Z517_01028 [Fonsecaea pedrosoi CBS 271.37]